MATFPPSGPAKLSDASATFGGSVPHRLSEYYRGGSYVPATRTTTSQSIGSYTAGEYQPFAGSSQSYYESNGRVVWRGTVIRASGTGIEYGYVDKNGYRYDQTTVGGDTEGIRRAKITTTNSTTNINAGVPSSGAISLSKLRGATST